MSLELTNELKIIINAPDVTSSIFCGASGTKNVSRSTLLGLIHYLLKHNNLIQHFIIQKKPFNFLKGFTFWVEDRARTGDPWYHKPML